MKATKEMVDRAQSVIEAHAITPRHVVEEALNAALALLQSSAPEWQLVPREPNVGMFRALMAWAKDTPELQLMMVQWITTTFGDDYRAMLAAAPATPGSLASHPAASPELIAAVERLEALVAILEQSDVNGAADEKGPYEQLRRTTNDVLAAVRSLPFAEIVVALKGGVK